VHQLRNCLDAELLYIGEFLGSKNRRVRTIAACAKRDQTDVFDFSLDGSPEAEVASGNSCMFSRSVRQMFPEHRLLWDLQVEAYVGIPLNDPEGHPCGVIAAFFREPLDLEISFVQAMLNAFVPRSSAEINRKRADDTLREHEQRYRTFVELNPDACWRLEFDQPIDTALPENEQLERILGSGRLAEGNDALAQKLGLNRIDEVIGEPFTKAVPDAQNTEACMLALIRSGYRRSTIEVTAVLQNKRCHFVHSIWGIVESDRLLRIWGSSRDVTELRELEARFRHVQKLDSIGRLAAGIAHDFNNLLTVVQGFTAELLAGKNSVDKDYSSLNEIRKAVEKGTALTSQLLTFSYGKTPRLQVLNLSSVVADAEAMLRRVLNKNIELVMHLDALSECVRADAGYIHQVLLNLAVNAQDAMPKGGRLRISLASVDIGGNRPGQPASIRPGAYVLLNVTDNGTGMTSDIEEHLFEPFFTTKEKGRGTGLGLSTVYGIVKQMGGHIVVETAPNRGASFDIFLPRVSSAAVHP